MAELNLSLDVVFEQMFGYRSQAFDPKFNAVQGDVKFKRTEQGKVAGSPYYKIDAAGREYYMPVEVNVGFEKMPGKEITYAQALGVTNTDGSLAGRWDLPYPVISISSRKCIIETPLTDRRGTVKELINIEDYRITIRGFIVNHKANELPEDDILTMRKLYELNVAIKISNPLLDAFLISEERDGSDLVVIKDLQFRESPGVKNVKGYIMELASDEPFNLIDIS